MIIVSLNRSVHYRVGSIRSVACGYWKTSSSYDPLNKITRIAPIFDNRLTAHTTVNPCCRQCCEYCWQHALVHLRTGLATSICSWKQADVNIFFTETWTHHIMKIIFHATLKMRYLIIFKQVSTQNFAEFITVYSNEYWQFFNQE